MILAGVENRYSIMSASREYSLPELQSLLSLVRQEIDDSLLSPAHHHNELYFRNFTALSLRALRHTSIYLTQLKDKPLGGMLAEIVDALGRSWQDYKGRNIRADSPWTDHLARDSFDQHEEDEIYHFMNTRNSALPLECLPNAEMERQRSELAQFVAGLEHKSKNAIPKEAKRSLVLPKDTSLIKFARKATYDAALTSKEEQTRKMSIIQKSDTISDVQGFEKETKDEEPKMQDKIEEKEEKEGGDKGLAAIAEQCGVAELEEVDENPSQGIGSEAAVSVDVSRRGTANELKSSKKILGKEKKKAKGSDVKIGSKSKKKAKFNTLEKCSDLLSKQPKTSNKLQNPMERTILTPQSRACSLKLVRYPGMLTLCSRQVEISYTKMEEMTITISCSPYVAAACQTNSEIAYIQYSSKQTQKNLDEIAENLEIIRESETKQIDLKTEIPQRQSEGNSMKDKTSEEMVGVKKMRVLKSDTLQSNTSSIHLPTSSLRIIETPPLFYHPSPALTSPIHPPIQPKRKTLLARQFLHNPNDALVSGANAMPSHFRASKISLEKQIKVAAERASPDSEDGLSQIASCRTEDYLNSLLQGESSRPQPRQTGMSSNSIHKSIENVNTGGAIAESSPQKEDKKQKRGKGSFCFGMDTHKERLSAQDLIVFFAKGKENSQSKNKNIKQLKGSAASAYDSKQLPETRANSHQKIANPIQPVGTAPFVNSKIQQDIRKARPYLHRSSNLAEGQLSAIPEFGKGEEPSKHNTELTLADITLSRSAQTSQPHVLPHGYRSSPKSCKSLHRPATTIWDSMGELMRGRGRKQKLRQYLELIEATHRKFCGQDCVHVANLYEEGRPEEAVVGQLLRLLNRKK